jgi:uncharacterized protein (TIGR02421 family)
MNADNDVSTPHHADRAELRRLLTLDRHIVEIASWLAPSRLLNPTLDSRRAAMTSFRAALQRHHVEDPTFAYLPLPFDLIDATARALDALRFEDTEVDLLLQDQAHQLRLQLDLLLARGTPRFGQLAAQIYGLPDAALLNTAERILQGLYLVHDVPDTPEPLGGPRLNAAQLADAMRDALLHMDIHDWQVVVVDEMSARMSVSARHREVRVKSDSLFSLEDRDRLIIHELRTHVRRACNGFQSGLLNLGLGLQDYMATEEGLASWMEQKHNLLRRAQIETYAWRALGASLGHQHGFAQTFRELMARGASPSLAWDVTLRVKRGLEDTSISGCFPKDYVYLHGREIVHQYLRDGGSEDDLFLGKISIDQIPLIKRILHDWRFDLEAAHFTPTLPSPPQGAYA